MFNHIPFKKYKKKPVNRLELLTIKRVLSVFAVLFFVSLTVTANTGPGTWHSSPLSESLSVDEDSQIEVLSEELTFEMPYQPIGDNQLYLSTRAVYEMHNTSLEPDLVTMAFPFVGRMTEVNKEDIVVAVNGQAVDYNIYPGDQVHSNSSGYDTGDYYKFDFEQRVKDISEVTYWSYLLNDEVEGTHYSLHTTSKSPSMRVRVTLTGISDGVQAIGVGPSNAFSEGNNLYFEGLCTRDTPFDLFVFGGEATIKVVAFESQADQKGLDSSHYEVTEVGTTYGSFYNTSIDPEARKVFPSTGTSPDSGTPFDQKDRYNILTELFKEALSLTETRAITATESKQFIQQFSPERYMTLVYQVPFEADGIKEVSVSYRSMASYDTKASDVVIYSFDYLLSPAASWKSFKDLTIDIHTDKVMGPLLESSLEFEQIKDDHYRGVFTELPDKELRVTFEGPALEDPNLLSEDATLSFKEKYGLDIFEEKLEKYEGALDFNVDIDLDVADIIGMVIGLLLLIAGVWILIIRRLERKNR